MGKTVLNIIVGIVAILLVAYFVFGRGSANNSTTSVNSAVSTPSKACIAAPAVGTVFHWDITEIFKDEKSHAIATETILARQGRLTLRLLAYKPETTDLEISNPVHYGPLFLGEFEDWIDVQSIYDAPGLQKAFPDIDRTLRGMDAGFREDPDDMMTAFDDIWDNGKDGMSVSFKYAGFDHVLTRWDVNDLIPFKDKNTPTNLFAIERKRFLRDKKSYNRRSYWFTKDDCQLVRYSTAFVIPSSSQSTEYNLVKVEN
ncbi:MAG: hypothetical protein HKO02_14365 [Hyphomonadaceae bacterium]|nr:hypothetical protein [Hyphomonadaceae bacterium]